MQRNSRAVANCLSLYYLIPQISFLAHEHLTYVITTDSWVYREILTVRFINSHWAVYSTKLKVYTYQTTSCDSVSNFCQDLKIYCTRILTKGSHKPTFKIKMSYRTFQNRVKWTKAWTIKQTLLQSTRMFHSTSHCHRNEVWRQFFSRWVPVSQHSTTLNRKTDILVWNLGILFLLQTRKVLGDTKTHTSGKKVQN